MYFGFCSNPLWARFTDEGIHKKFSSLIYAGGGEESILHTEKGEMVARWIAVVAVDGRWLSVSWFVTWLAAFVATFQVIRRCSSRTTANMVVKRQHFVLF